MAVFLQVITLFLLIFCGFFSAKGKLVDENGISTLNKIVLYFALPALTLYGLQKDASPELIHDLILVFFISLAIMILSGLIAYFLYRSEPNERRSVLTNLSMLSNSAYMGYPVVIATLGEDMLIYAVVFVGLIALMIVIRIEGKISTSKKTAAAPAAAPAPAPAAKPEPVLAAGTAGELKLHDVAPKDAAMIMAVVAYKLGKPLNELRFKSIKEVK